MHESYPSIFVVDVVDVVCSVLAATQNTRVHFSTPSLAMLCDLSLVEHVFLCFPNTFLRTMVHGSVTDLLYFCVKSDEEMAEHGPVEAML